MIREVLRDEGIDTDRSLIIPFPVNDPARWQYYLPPGAVHYLRVFSDWEQAKVDRLREHGYTVEVLHPGIAKEIEASEVRRRMANGEDWQSLVPSAVVRVLERLRESAGTLS
jgi:nicotinamide mononucleotide adenylyltransferase